MDKKRRNAVRHIYVQSCSWYFLTSALRWVLYYGDGKILVLDGKMMIDAGITPALLRSTPQPNERFVNRK